MPTASTCEQKETLAELDRQMAHLLVLLDKKAGPQRVVAVTADHGMPAEPAPGHRHYPDEIVAALVARFDPKGNQALSSRTTRMPPTISTSTPTGCGCWAVRRIWRPSSEGQEYFAAAFTEDEVVAAQQRLPHMTPLSR